MATNYQNFFEKDYQELLNKYDKKSEEYKILKYEYQLLQSKYNTLQKNIEEQVKREEAKYLDIINEKDKEIERLKSLLNIDGTNSNIPTSQTPINKKKVVPNSRVKSGKKIGGQLGHKQHKLEKFKEEEINDVVLHELQCCPECGGKISELSEIDKDEFSYRFVPIKRRHRYITYQCACCHKIVCEKNTSKIKRR